jgi:hypothetical protein
VAAEDEGLDVRIQLRLNPIAIGHRRDSSIRTQHHKLRSSHCQNESHT